MTEFALFRIKSVRRALKAVEHMFEYARREQVGRRRWPDFA